MARKGMRELKISKQITDRHSSKSLDLHLSEIAQKNFIPLSPEQEVELAKQIAKGSDEALKKLVIHNLRFVVSVAKQYQNQGLPLMDLIIVGSKGLIKAAKRFDYTRGFKFISYAVWWIRQSMLQALAEESRIVRLPLNRVSFVNMINRLQDQFEQEHGRRPTIEELSEKLGIPSKEIRHTLQVASRHLSLNRPFVQGEDNTLLDVLEDDQLEVPEHNLTSESLTKEISKQLNHLSEREAEVIRDYFGLGRLAKTLEEIAQKTNLTRERVRQIKESGLRSLRDKLGNLRGYLGS